ncbi:MAG: cysteine desulfurase family protein [Planctomycetota bacterium]|nr:cysteine desulfurase family protein [Planctomycetota bacterium]
MNSIYFDNNATTRLDPVVADKMHQLHLMGIYNPASQHRLGRQALSFLEEAKQQILEAVGAPCSSMDSAQIILNSGGTESNNLAIFGLLERRPGYVFVGGTDHPSVIEAGKHFAGSDDRFRVLPTDSLGICDFDLLQSWLADIHDQGEVVSCVSVMLGNNETGVLQDLKCISQLCAKYDVPVHSDIVQALGKSPINMQELGLSALTLTGHKIHGPVGIGALILASDVKIDPMIIGGGQQLGLRAGTEPVVPAVGLASAVSEIIGALDKGHYEELRLLRDRFESRLIDSCDAVVIAADAPRLPHTSNLSFPGIDRQALQMALDLNGLACSTGSACSSGSGRPSGSLVAMGLPLETIEGSLRFSFSRFTTADEIDRGLLLIEKAIEKCRTAA